jgi:hypothetical protein
VVTDRTTRLKEPTHMDHTSITSDAAELRDLVSPKRYLINKALRILGQKESEEKQLLDYKIFSKQNGCPKTCRDILLWPFRCMAIFPHSTGYPKVHHLIPATPSNSGSAVNMKKWGLRHMENASSNSVMEHLLLGTCLT